jgi:hypothetical protein
MKNNFFKNKLRRIKRRGEKQKRIYELEKQDPPSYFYCLSFVCRGMPGVFFAHDKYCAGIRPR